MRTTEALSERNALQRAADLCNRSEHSPNAVRKKLVQWGMKADEVERIVDRLTDLNLLNEQRYARAFAHDKFKYNGWGKEKIERMLRIEGIGVTLIREALDSIPEDQYLEKLSHILAQKNHTLKDDDPRQRRLRLLRFAFMRGFSGSDISRCLPSDFEE